VPKLEHVSDFDGRRNVADAEVIALAAVNTNGDADHARNRRTRRSCLASWLRGTGLRGRAGSRRARSRSRR
jgi:hypothetical protein